MKRDEYMKKLRRDMAIYHIFGDWSIKNIVINIIKILILSILISS
jgi:hypothetical protein